MGTKFPNINDIAWGKIRQVRVSSDPGKNSYGFEFSLNGRKQKMTIAIDSDSTSYTLSSAEGDPIIYGVQRGKEFKVIDFSAKPRISGAAGRIRKIGKIRKK